MARNYYDGWAPYVAVAQRQRQAAKQAAVLQKKGQICQPVLIEGRTICRSFWGKAWCNNLEAYSDFANRLPRGRSYVRNGSVIDLRIETGKVSALVSGSQIYSVEIGVQPLAAAAWSAVIKECSGQVASLIELLQGRLSKAVMQTVTRHGQGLFPLPGQIRLRCSCPDSALMCKHVAAALYGVGARLDAQPELLFQLRHVDPQELIRQLGSTPARAADTQGALDGADLSALFGIDLDDAPGASTSPPSRPAAPPTKRVQAPKAAAPKPSSAPVKSGKTVTASELISRGVARHMIQGWIASGVLLRTAQRGVYQTTAQTQARILAYAARAAGGRLGRP